MKLPLAPLSPEFLFLEINRRCNLRCNHCDFWLRSDKNWDNYLSHHEIALLLGTFSAMGGNKVVICGGEPLLEFDRYMKVCGYARSSKLRILSVVSGTAPGVGAEEIELLAKQGPQEISISFDDFREEEHNFFRGSRKGTAYSRSLVFLGHLLRARDAGFDVEYNNDHPAGRPLEKIQIMYLVHGANYLELPRAYKWAESLGVDKLKLNFIQPSFGGRAERPDKTFERYSGIDPDRLLSVLLQCQAEFGVKYNEAWLRSVLSYFDGLKRSPNSSLIYGWMSQVESTDVICNTWERNIMVSAEGRAQLCFNAEFRGESLRAPHDMRPGLGLFSPELLKKFWSEATDIREAMQGCKKPCGISHSVRRESCYAHYPEKL